MTVAEELSAEVCRFLLSSEEVGRVAFVGDDGYPVVLPVNYRLQNDVIVFRTAPGAKLDLVPMRPVAFQVDHLAPTVRAGWSVLVQGVGHDLTTAIGPEYEQMREETLVHWDPGAKDHWLGIVIHSISGRQIANPRTPSPQEPPGDY
jgi:hypothetical protein